MFTPDGFQKPRDGVLPRPTVEFTVANTSGFAISGEGWGITPSGAHVKFKKPKDGNTEIIFKATKKKMSMLQNYNYQKRIKQLEDMVAKADENGQIAFSESLFRRLLVLTREAELYALKYRLFVEHDMVQKFIEKSNNKIFLTPIMNFARPIPKYVLTKKKECDTHKLFDEYYVLHMDGKNVVQDTEKQKEARKKDPILFGVIEFSTKLYFVDEWEDELCDLTLDQLIDTMGLTDEDVELSKKPTL